MTLRPIQFSGLLRNNHTLEPFLFLYTRLELAIAQTLIEAFQVYVSGIAKNPMAAKSVNTFRGTIIMGRLS